jgi:hypothetical protein
VAQLDVHDPVTPVPPLLVNTRDETHEVQLALEGPVHVAQDESHGAQVGLDVDVHVPLKNWLLAQSAKVVHWVHTGLDVAEHVPLRYWLLEHEDATVHGVHTRSLYEPSPWRPHERVSYEPEPHVVQLRQAGGLRVNVEHWPLRY